MTAGADGTAPGRFGKFTLLRPIARGGMSQVWAAEDAQHHACVVKLLRSVWLKDATAKRRFLEEAELLARFDHPGIVKVLECGETQDRLYVALEPIHGVPLLSLMTEVARRGRVLPPAASSRIIIDVAEALHHAHKRVDKNGAQLRVVHRDVSPSNVMVCRDGAVKLIDFGLARSALFEDGKAGAGAIHGTLPYMSPEQVSGEDVDARSDLYACAVILYELLLGRPYFGGLLAEQAVELLARGYLPPGLSVLEPKLRGVLEKALAVVPAARYESAGVFSAALEDAVPPLETPQLGALATSLA